ncbi:MAG: Abi family protein [Solibacillus isronensis]
MNSKKFFTKRSKRFSRVKKHSQINKYRKRIARKPNFTKLENAKAEGIKIKDFYPSEKLIKELKTKLNFSDTEEIIAASFFKDVNYYRFSIYPKLLPKHTKFNFSDALNLYYFDEFLKSNLYEFTSYFENKFKGSLIGFLGNTYKETDYYMSQCYLDLSLYEDKKWGKSVIQAFEKRINESKSPAIIHHRLKKNDFTPIWVLLEEVTFGELETFITQLRKPYPNEFVKYMYQNAKYPKVFNGWISLIRELRNKISHHSRLYGTKFSKPPGVIKTDTKVYFPSLKDRSDLKNMIFSCFYVLHKLVLFENTTICNQWNAFLLELELKVKELDSILAIDKHMGFPPNWSEILKVR